MYLILLYARKFLTTILQHCTQMTMSNRQTSFNLLYRKNNLKLKKTDIMTKMNTLNLKMRAQLFISTFLLDPFIGSTVLSELRSAKNW